MVLSPRGLVTADADYHTPSASRFLAHPRAEGAWGLTVTRELTLERSPVSLKDRRP